MNARDREWRLRRLHGAKLYVVTDARQRQGDLDDFLDAILSAGTDIIQLREKTAEAADLLRWAEHFRAAAARHGALFIVNDRPDVARAAGADGVHVGQNDLPVRIAREVAGDALLVGLSTHSPRELDTASAEADYVCAGPVYATPTKPGRSATGLELIEHAARVERSRPWFAIGGIDETTVVDVKRAGAQRLVVVRAVCDAGDPAAAVRELRCSLDDVDARLSSPGA